jgi:rhodanese-related sulfurtransferase
MDPAPTGLNSTRLVVPTINALMGRMIEIRASELTTAEPDAEKPSLLDGTNSRGQTTPKVLIRSAGHRSAIGAGAACPVWTGCAVYGCVIDGGAIRSSRSFTNHRSPIRSGAAGSIYAIDASGSIRRVADSKSREQDRDCEYSAFHVTISGWQPM